MHILIVKMVFSWQIVLTICLGLIKMKDAETGERLWVDTSSRKVRMMYKNIWDERKLKFQQMISKAGVDSVSMEASDDYVKALMRLFKMRN